MGLLTNDGFLAQLGVFFAETAKSGSVFITVKQVPSKPAADGTPGPCVALYRATAHKRTIATTVATDDLARFQANFTTLMKASTSALRKAKKAKAAAAAKKHGGATAATPTAGAAGAAAAAGGSRASS